MATDNLFIRFNKTDTLLLQLKELANQENHSFAAMIKYVLACSILNQTPHCIAKIHVESQRKSSVILAPVRISSNDYNGIILEWLQKTKLDTTVKVSRYIKFLLVHAIETCDSADEQMIFDNYDDETRLNMLSSNYEPQQIPQILQSAISNGNNSAKSKRSTAYTKESSMDNIPRKIPDETTKNTLMTDYEKHDPNNVTSSQKEEHSQVSILSDNRDALLKKKSIINSFIR